MNEAPSSAILNIGSRVLSKTGSPVRLVKSPTRTDTVWGAFAAEGFQRTNVPTTANAARPVPAMSHHLLPRAAGGARTGDGLIAALLVCTSPIHASRSVTISAAL